MNQIWKIMVMDTSKRRIRLPSGTVAHRLASLLHTVLVAVCVKPTWREEVYLRRSHGEEI